MDQPEKPAPKSEPLKWGHMVEGKPVLKYCPKCKNVDILINDALSGRCTKCRYDINKHMDEHCSRFE